MTLYDDTHDMNFPAKAAGYFIASIGPFWLFGMPIALVGFYLIAAFQKPKDWPPILVAAVLWTVLLFGRVVWSVS